MQTGTPSWWNEALAYLANDELMGPVLATYPDGSLVGKGDAFCTVVRSIVGQQISVLAADAVWARLESFVGAITPENIRSKQPEELAACGLTRSKASYIHGLAEQSEALLSQDWTSMDDTAIHAHFTSFRGIGPWTSEMVCIFALLRPDVFSIGDIGLIKAVKILDPSAETKEDVLRVAERWAPYRTAASWYLWRMLDPVPVEY
jgi:DNA-3-methyladenine glycosylase II